jgi:hypothetical protein
MRTERRQTPLKTCIGHCPPEPNSFLRVATGTSNRDTQLRHPTACFRQILSFLINSVTMRPTTLSLEKVAMVLPPHFENEALVIVVPNKSSCWEDECQEANKNSEREARNRRAPRPPRRQASATKKKIVLQSVQSPKDKSHASSSSAKHPMNPVERSLRRVFL